MPDLLLSTGKEKFFYTLIEHHQGIIALLDENLRVLFRSAFGEKSTGWSNDEISYAPNDYTDPEIVDQVRSVYEDAVANPDKTIPITTRMKHKNGQIIWLEGTVTNKLTDPDIGGIVLSLQDVTAQKKAEEKLLRLNRLYFFMSQMNQAIVKAPDAPTLFKEACRIAVEAGQFRMAWIGLIDEATCNLIPVVHAGEEADYLSKIRIMPLAGPAESMGPGGRALREGTHIICNDIESAPEMAPWRDAALGRGYLSSIGLPLKRSDKVVGLFSLYASKKDFFDAEETNLLVDMANDICFALELHEQEALRKKAEQELLQSKLSYQTLTETSPVGIFHTDAAGITTYVSQRWCQIAGLSAENALGESWLEAVHPDDRENLMREWKEAIREQRPSTAEYRIIRPDGFTVWILGQAIPERGIDNQVIGYVGTATDITQQVLAQDQIVNERNLSNTVINSLPGVFYVFNREGRYLRWNNNLEKVTQYSADEIARIRPQDFIDREEQQLLAEKVESVFRNGEDTMQAWLVRKDKTKVPYFFTGKAVEYQGEECLLGVGLDFSDRLKAQEKIKETTNQLRELADHLQNIREEERTEIARDIHDDLGQQLTAVKISLFRLAKQLGQDQALEKQVQAISDMIAQAISSIRRISTQLRPAVLDDIGLTEAMKWQTDEFEKRFSIPVTTFFSDIPDNLQRKISVALFRIYQETLTNIVRHAGACNVQVRLTADDKQITLEIKDDGKGFDEDIISSKRTLGLLGMKERALMIGGEFDVCSRPGKGTLINIKVPLDKNK